MHICGTIYMVVLLGYMAYPAYTIKIVAASSGMGLCPSACPHPLLLIHLHRLPGKTILGGGYIGYLVFGLVG